MLPAILFFTILITPPFFLAIWKKRRFEDSIALTTGGLILVMFLFGIVGLLRISVYVILSVALILLILSAYKILREKTPVRTLAPFFTPAALAFFLIYIFLLYVHYERMLHEYDEFTHWGDVVKAMCHIDDFATNPLSHSLFQNYVPGMALFQYLFEKLAMIFPGGIFVDWRLYFAYHLLAAIFLLPLITELKWRFFIPVFLLFLFIAAAPMLLYPDGNYLTSVYIDGFVGLLAGAGFAILFLKEPSNRKTAHLLVICSLLVLSKDVGMLFAVALGIALLISEASGKKPKKLLKLMALTAAAVALPKILWAVNIKTNGATSLKFTDPIDLGVLWRVITGQETGVLAEIPRKYFERLLTQPIELAGTIRINLYYPAAAAVLIALLILAGILWRRQAPETKYRHRVVMWIAVFVLVAYCLGMPVLYMFKFGAPTLTLPSMDRYLSIVITFLLVMVFLLFFGWMQEKPKWIVVGIGTFAIIGLLTLNPTAMGKYFSRFSVTEDYYTQGRYEELVHAMNDISDGEEKHVWIICQESTGYEFWPIRYGIRPNNGQINVGFSISAVTESLYPGDMWTIVVPTEEWREKLKDYDYVMIWYANDSFREDYSALFEKPVDIADKSIFSVNHDTNLLERVWVAG